MPSRAAPPAALAILLVAAALAGCAAPAERTQGPWPGGSQAALPPDPPAVDAGHDHADPRLHPERAHGLRRVASVPYAVGPLAEAGVLDGAYLGGRMVEAGDLLLVTAIRGVPRAGFAAVDVRDPRAPVALGAYRSAYGASEGEALAATPDGRWAFLGIEGAYSEPPVPPAIEVVDLADPARPRLAARVPWPGQPHVLGFFEDDARGYLVASEYELSLPAAGALPVTPAVHGGVGLYAFDPAAATLTPVGRHVFDPAEALERGLFAHDPVVVEHPATGQRLLYLAAFGGGGLLLDLADPSRPRLVGQATAQGHAPVLRHHSFAPAPALVDGLLPTAAVPRSRAADGAAYLTLYDTADPARPRWLGEWRHPDPGLVPGDAPPMNLHVPAWAFGGTALLVPHFHAGLFLFDLPTAASLAAPRPAAWWTPPPAEPLPAGASSAGVIGMAVERGGVVLATEPVGAVLHVLERVDG